MSWDPSQRECNWCLFVDNVVFISAGFFFLDDFYSVDDAIQEVVCWLRAIVQGGDNGRLVVEVDARFVPAGSYRFEEMKCKEHAYQFSFVDCVLGYRAKVVLEVLYISSVAV